MPNGFDLPQDPQLANKIIDSKNEISKKKIEHGFLGLVWGSSSSIPNNIAALTIIVLVLFGVIYSISISYVKIEEKVLTVKDCWTIITPIVTLAFGYLFGDKSKKDAP